MSSKKNKHRKNFEESLMEELTHDRYPQHKHEQHHQHHECPKCHECRKHHEDQKHHECQEHHHHQEHHEHMAEDKDCICSTVKRIFKAQEEVDECHCRVSCERSIRQILSQNDCSPNTIPFTLTCGCDLFFGKAAIYSKHGHFCIISSPFFKVKKVDHNCCAVLELLWPTCDGEPVRGPLKCKDHDFLCDDFNGFIGTGSCITVDLSCFCSISCQKPHMVNEATTSQIQQIIKGHKCQ